MGKNIQIYCNGVYTPVDGDIEVAKAQADEEACYCQANIIILAGEDSLMRRWWGCLEGIEDQEDPIQIGDGFYSDWEECPDWAEYQEVAE